MSTLEVKIMLVGIRMKPKLLEGGCLLLFLEILVPLVHFIKKPAEVVKLANRRFGVRLYFDKVLIPLFCYTLCINGFHHLLCSVRKDNSDFRNTDLFIDPIGKFGLLSRNLLFLHAFRFFLDNQVLPVISFRSFSISPLTLKRPSSPMR